MDSRIRHTAAACQANLDGQCQRDRDKSLVLRLLREAIDESKWKHEALAAHLSAALGLRIDGPYLSKMLAGEKPVSLDHINALPDDIERIYYRLRGESLHLIVVEPVDPVTAARYFATALLSGVLQSALPVRASAMARADLPEPVVQRRQRS